jgi:hypothetical protein
MYKLSTNTEIGEFMNWPNNKKFAFTIIDDTDNSTFHQNKVIYDFLDSLGFKTTKTVWVYDSRDQFTGVTLEDPQFCDYLLTLKKKGFELALHNVGSGLFYRDEIIKGLEVFKSKLGDYPNIHINHSSNADNIYWGYERFNGVFRKLFRLIYGESRIYNGSNPESLHFWGDIHKKYIKYTRNYVFQNINTLKMDKKTPYIDPRKLEYSNYWFSSSDADSKIEFCDLLSNKNIEKLEKQNGACLIYTHFATGFVNEEGNLDNDFVETMIRLSKKNGYYANASQILDFLELQSSDRIASKSYLLWRDIIWLRDRLVKIFKYGK